MTRADFTTCGRNIFPAPNRSPTTPMPSMSGPSMTSSGRPAQLLGVVDDVVVDALDQRVRDPLPHRQRAPLLERGLGRRAAVGVLAGDLQQPLGGVGAAVEHRVLDALAQLGVDLVVDGE